MSLYSVSVIILLIIITGVYFFCGLFYQCCGFSTRQSCSIKPSSIFSLVCVTEKISTIYAFECYSSFVYFVSVFGTIFIDQMNSIVDASINSISVQVARNRTLVDIAIHRILLRD